MRYLLFAMALLLLPLPAQAEEEIVFRFTPKQAEEACAKGSVRLIRSEDGNFELLCKDRHNWALLKRGKQVTDHLRDDVWQWDPVVKGGTRLFPLEAPEGMEAQP